MTATRAANRYSTNWWHGIITCTTSSLHILDCHTAVVILVEPLVASSLNIGQSKEVVIVICKVCREHRANKFSVGRFALHTSTQCRVLDVVKINYFYIEM